MNLRFILFMGQTYYSGPGWDCFKGNFSSLEKAITKVDKVGLKGFDWAQVVDADKKEIVWTKGELYT